MKKLLAPVIILLPLLSAAQSSLTLGGVIDTTLKNNYDIQIAKNNSEIDRISNTFGFAGGLPTVSGAVNGNASVVDLNQKLNSGKNTAKNGG